VLTVALIGPDGAGKTTISRRLVDELGVPVKPIYMGVNLDSSRLMLPTTWLVVALNRARGRRPDLTAASDAEPPRPRQPTGRAVASLKAGARLGVWLSEEWFRQLVAWYYSALRGHVVVFDRHFYADYYDYDVLDRKGPRTMSRRIHGFLLEHAYPKPDVVICLDAPAEILFERKGEASIEWLRRRREEYLRLEEVVDHFVRVDAARPTDEVAREVAAIILSFMQAEADAGPRATGERNKG
jgi:thymidylate kinase